MGLFTAIVTLPLAPVRGVAWVAEQVAEEAERQQKDDSQIRRDLLQLELDRDMGVIDDDQYSRSADALVRRLAQKSETGGVLETTPWGMETRDG